MASKNLRTVFPTVAQAFINQVRTNPSREVYHYKSGSEWKAVTWLQHFENVREIFAGLRPTAGDKICILSNTRMEWQATDMAILAHKCITVPIYGSSTADDCAYVFNHCEAKILFVEDQKQLEKMLSVREKLPRLEQIIVFDPSATKQMAEAKNVLSLAALKEIGRRALATDSTLTKKFEENLLAVKPSDVFTICYTSGTTGVPKGVVLTFDSMTSIIEDVDKSIGDYIREDDVILSFLPISHIFGKAENMASYHFNWKVYYAESIDKIFLNISEVRPTLLFAVPRIFEKAYGKIKSSIDDSSPLKKKLFDIGMQKGKAYYEKVWNRQTPSMKEYLEYKLFDKLVFSKVYAKFGGRLRYCVAGGAPLPKAIGEFMQIIGISILEGYGLTETCAPVTVNRPYALKFGTIGQPFDEVAIRVADDGELLVKSRKVFKEYYKNPEATQEVLGSDGWFHTGDIGVIDDEGFIKITDRKKDLIVTSGGKNIAPQKIENLAKSSKFISQLVVFGDQKNFLTALVALEKEALVKFAKEENILFSEYKELVKHQKVQALVQKIINNLNAGLASYETIKRFSIVPQDFSVETGELTPSLKVRRKFCSQKYKDLLDEMYGQDAA